MDESTVLYYVNSDRKIIEYKIANAPLTVVDGTGNEIIIKGIGDIFFNYEEAMNYTLKKIDEKKATLEEEMLSLDKEKEEITGKIN